MRTGLRAKVSCEALNSPPVSSVPPRLNTLQRAELGFLRRLLQERPLLRPASGIAGHVARTHHIGERSLTPGKICYADADFERAQAVVMRLGGVRVGPVLQPAPQDGNSAPLSQGGASPHTTRSPRTDADLLQLRVAFAEVAIGGSAAPPPSYQFACTSVEAALQWRVDVLLVAGDLDTLQWVREAQWLHEQLQGRSCTAVYQGAGAFLPPNAVNALLKTTSARVWALCDFTPSGLAWASRVPRLDALALPPPAALATLVAERPVPGFLGMMRAHARALSCEPRPVLRGAFVQMQLLGGGALARDLLSPSLRTASDGPDA